MKKEECKPDLKIVWIDKDGRHNYGTIMNKEFTFKYDNAVWVMWEDLHGNGSHPAWIDCELISLARNGQMFTIEEINAMLDELVANADETTKDDWYCTDKDIITAGADSFRSYLKEKYQKLALKEQAMAKLAASLTKEEIEALGINE